MEPWEYDEIFNTTHTIEEPNEIPPYDPYDEEQMAISDYEVETWRLEAQIGVWAGEEVRL